MPQRTLIGFSLLPLLLLAGMPAAAQVSNPAQYCDHPLLPLRTDIETGNSVWSYAETGTEKVSIERQTRSVLPVTRESAMAVLSTAVSHGEDGTPLVVPSAYLCSGEGIEVTIPDQISIPLPVDGLVLDIGLKSREGVALPPFDQIQVGASWQAHYVLEVAILRGETERVTLEVDVAMDASVAGLADVVVPAGSFLDTWVIDQQFSIHVRPPRPAPARVASAPAIATSVDRTLYLAEGVGLVHMQVLGRRQGDKSLDLVDYFVPEVTD